MTRLFKESSEGRHSEFKIHLLEWLEMFCMQILLTLALWPLKLIYKRPRPDETWPAWQANQKLCRIDRRYC